MASQSVCLTPACAQAGATLLSYMSPNYTTLDPCTKWDQYVCQGFRNTHVRRPDQIGVSVDSVIADNVQAILRGVLEGPYPGESNHSSFSPRNLISVRASVDEDNFNLMKSFYNACMDEPTLKTLGIKPLVDLLGEVAKLLPVDDSAYGKSAPLTPADDTSIRDTYAFLSDLNVGTFEDFGPTTDDKFPDKYSLVLFPTESQTLPTAESYAQPDLIAEYRKVMTSTLQALYPNQAGRDAAAHLADLVIKLETQFISVRPSLEDMREPQAYYNPMSLNDTVALIPQLGLEHFIKTHVPSNYTVDYIITSFPNYLRNVSSILSTTPKEGLQAYFIWTTLATFQGSVIAPEVQTLRRFFRILNGQDPDAERPRWRTCLSSTSSALSWIVGRFFVEAAFSEAAKNLGDQMVVDLRAEFIKRFQAAVWMEDVVKTRAIEKINKLIQKMGYPTASPNTMDPNSLRDYYANLHLTSSFFGNVLALPRFSNARSFANLPKPVDRNKWGMSPQTVNAYYDPSSNQIVFPAAIMQPPYFQVGLPDYINYGAFGSVVGHEMSHGFDTMGKQYDGDGKLTDWWSENTTAEFLQRAQCFIDQYNNWTYTGPDGKAYHGSGELASGEDIADSGGLSIAFSAWKTRQGATPNQKLPGLEGFTNEQLFFISYATGWCEDYVPDAVIQQMLTNEHPPGAYRSTAPVENTREWKVAFNCPVKEPACQLW